MQRINVAHIGLSKPVKQLLLSYLVAVAIMLARHGFPLAPYRLKPEADTTPAGSLVLVIELPGDAGELSLPIPRGHWWVLT